MTKISIWDKLNTVRMIVLLEQTPFSNKYSQILLDGDQYAEASKLIYSLIARDSPEHKKVCMNPNCNGKSFEVGTEDIELPDLQHITENKTK